MKQALNPICKSLLLSAAIGIAAISPASAQETKTYTYDALGRLVEVKRDKSNGNEEKVDYTYDAAGNRVTYTSDGAATGDANGGGDGGSTTPPEEPQYTFRPVFNGRFMVMQRFPTN